MDVRAGGDRREDKFGKGEGKGVAHCIDEYIGDKEGESVIGKDNRAYRLPEKCEMRPSRA